MIVKKAIVTNGLIIGAILDDNGVEKRARLADLRKLVDKNKITSGARVIQGELYIDENVLREETVQQQSFELSKIIYNDDGQIISALLKDGRTIDANTMWSLAADLRLNGIIAGYNRDTDTKIVLTT